MFNMNQNINRQLGPVVMSRLDVLRAPLGAAAVPMADMVHQVIDVTDGMTLVHDPSTRTGEVVGPIAGTSAVMFDPVGLSSRINLPK